MSEVLPLFSTHYSYSQGGILTLTPAGSAKPGNPVSVFDIAKENGLGTIVLVESKMDGFVEAVKNAEKAKIDKLILGVKLPVCNRLLATPEDATKTESSVIVFVKGYDGYRDLIKIYNRAWTTNHVGYGRTDWDQLGSLWTDNLQLGIPFFSSFIARNLLKGREALPVFPKTKDPILLFDEQGSDIPYANLIKQAIGSFTQIPNSNHAFEVVKSKSIYYKSRSDFTNYQVYRCILNRSEFSRPEVDGLCSDSFCWQSYQELTKS